MWQPYHEQWETGLHGISTEFPWGPSITDLKPALSWHSAVIHWELRRRFYVCRDVPPDLCLLWGAGPEHLFFKIFVLFFYPSLSKLSAQIQLNVCQFTDLHCDRRLSDLTWRNTHSAPRHRPLLPSSALLDNSATTSPSSSPTSEMPLVCERWRESVSEVSRSNISSSNTRWDTRTPEHDCWIENGLRSRYEWRACISLDMSVATIACRIGSHHHRRHPPSILSGAFGA